MSVEGERLTLRTPAKINLGLRIVGRRADGYHLLESIFVPVSLFDDLTLQWGPGPDRIELELELDPGAELPAGLSQVTDGADNLAVRAAEAFRRACPRGGTLRIQLRKRIPSGAGLGGGSSDAGAVITGLARLAGPAAPPPDALAEIALRLGADVPYFLRPTPAFVSGIGERIEPLEGLPSLSLLLANPGISVATAEVYRVSAALRDSLTDPGAGSTMRALSELRGEIGRWRPALGVLLRNDLESAAIRLCPPVGRLLARLRETAALGVGMSGSGGTVFGVYRSSVEAEQAAERLRGEGTATSRAAAATMEATRESERESGSAGDEGQEAIRAGAGPAAWLRVCSTPSNDSGTR